MDLSDEQWEVVRPLIPVPSKRTDGRGGPRVEDRKILDGILWVMRTGAPWHKLPDKYPPYQTCHRRFQQWRSAGVFKSIIESLARDLKDRGDLDLSECFIEGRFVIAKRGEGVRKTKRGKGTKIMAVAQGIGLPIAISIGSAWPHEVKLVEMTLGSSFIEETPQRMIGDRAFDSDPLDKRLKLRGIEMIAPHRSNRKSKARQDGRKLRRYKHRWKVERVFAWLQNFRRVLV